MKKNLAALLTTLLCTGMLADCSAQGNVPPGVPDASQPAMQKETMHPLSPPADASASYQKLIGYRTADYSGMRVADFNESIVAENGDLSELLAAHAQAMERITPLDENYDFITLTLAASLNELYCAQMHDEIGLSGYLQKSARPIAPLEGEGTWAQEQIAYDFLFTALYTIHYEIAAPLLLTIADRDHALRALQTKLQAYINGLSKAEMTDGHIRATLEKKASSLAAGLSTEHLALTCEIGPIEIHDSGVETQP